MTSGREAEHLPPAVQEAAARLEAMYGPSTPGAVACGVVLRTWREALEEHHGRLTDAEMGYTNIATTQAVLAYCRTDRVDWPSVRHVLFDPHRRVLPGRSARDVLDEAWPELTASLTELVYLIEVYPPGLLANFARLMCPHWWGMPGWPALASSVAASGRVTRWSASPPALTEALIEDPTSLEFGVWAQVVEAMPATG